ncbi:MAG: hypothetical protein A2V66_02730 [Ignavibacteria bacterium RBG_13_36_8]|nr:MAG: hypothetical protein A2V66_02730 [Ignavibacteria bacterium RBG_13_36_8]
MHIRIVISTVIILMVMLSCSSDSGTEPEDNGNGNGTAIVTGTIGSSGGTVSTDNLTIDVPSSAFGSNATVSVYNANVNLGVTSLSNSYRITGLPDNYNVPVTLRLRYSGTISGNGYVAVGRESVVKSAGGLETAYLLLPARDSSGYLNVDLPLAITVIAKSEAANIFTTSGDLNIQAVSATETNSTGGHFKIYHSSAYASQAQQLAGYLEEAYTTFTNMGFVFSASYPLEVNIIDLGNEYYGKYCYSLWSEWFEFNSRKMNESADLRTSAGHEFFHLVQMRYDSRSWASKLLGNGNALWMEEATAVWAEGKFSSNQNYVSDIRDGHQMSPFYGMQKGASTNATHHGYGMSAMIKYLVDKHGQNIVKSIFDRMKVGFSPVDAVFISNPDPVSFWCPEFLSELVLGEGYGDVIPARMATDSQTTVYELNYSADSLFTFSGNVDDLSGKLFVFKLNNLLFNPAAMMNLTLTASNDCKMHVFAYKGSTINYVGSSETTFPVYGLKALHDDSWHILVMITNTRMSSPYTGSTPITLRAHVTVPLFDYSIIKWVAVTVTLNTTIQHDNGEVTSGFMVYSFGNVSTLADAQGTWNGNTFTAPLSLANGTISVTIDPITAPVTHFSGSLTYSTGLTQSVSGSDIPFFWAVYDDDLNWVGYSCEVWGTETCTHISSLSTVQENTMPPPIPSNGYQLTGYSCDNISHISINFFWTEP